MRQAGTPDASRLQPQPTENDGQENRRDGKQHQTRDAMLGIVVTTKINGIVPDAPDDAGGNGAPHRAGGKEPQLKIAPPPEFLTEEDWSCKQRIDRKYHHQQPRMRRQLLGYAAQRE